MRRDDGPAPALWPKPARNALRDHAPCGHWETHTVIAGLRLEGLAAPGVFDGPIDNPSFRAYVEQVLAPTLRPGDVVVLDNLAVHKQPEVRAAIEAVGASSASCRRTVRTSTRSSWRSPNSKRSCAPLGPRTFDQVCLGRHRARTLHPGRMSNYVRHCGYRVATAL